MIKGCTEGFLWPECESGWGGQYAGLGTPGDLYNSRAQIRLQVPKDRSSRMKVMGGGRGQEETGKGNAGSLRWVPGRGTRRGFRFQTSGGHSRRTPQVFGI